jgi:DNA-binding response OmpR family regulator
MATICCEWVEDAIRGAKLVYMTALEVLVVEDAPEYQQIVVEVLRTGGHRVRTAGTIAEAEKVLQSTSPDLVILDLTLPDGDGLDLCRSIRERSTAYVLLLTGRDDEVDKVIGFRLGADDYVTKPFSPRELGVRIEALARRPRGPVAPVVDEFRHGDLVVRPASREVEVDGAPLELTRIEFDLLNCMIASPRQVFTRSQLLDAVWDDHYGDDHIVDVHIANLRKKLATVTSRQIVRTMRGVGYGLSS